MQYSVEKNYLVFPVSRNARSKTLDFYKDSGECVFSITLRLDYCTPEYEAYIDMKRFRGEFLDVTAEPYMRLDMRAKDRRPVCRFSETLRPKYHLTSPEGAMTSPFSAVYSAGMYHIFYLLNPAGTQGGNTHIGHAASKNLIDFEYFSEALFPDSLGDILCGCVLADDKNLLGTKNCEKTPVVFYYISEGGGGAAEPENVAACSMAVSCDGCAAFTKLPVGAFPSEEKGTKNPFVVYSTRYDIYVLVLESSGGTFPLYSSKDLKSWKKLGELSAAGLCTRPMFFPLIVEEKEEKWVLMDGNGRYTVGEFDGESFTADSDEVHTFNYSAIDGGSICRVAGVQDGRTVCFMNMPTEFAPFGMHFDGAMAFPAEMRLVRTENGDRIYVNPAKEIERLCGKKVKDNARSAVFGAELRGIAQDIRLEVQSMSAKKATMSIFGESFVLDFEQSTLVCGGCTMPICSCENGKIYIRLLCDTCGFEVYTAEGAAYMAICCIPDENLNVLEICADSEIGVKLEAFRLRDSRRNDKRR